MNLLASLKERNRMEKKCKVGDIRVYQEDDSINEIEILEDNSDVEKEDFVVKITKIIQESQRYKPPVVGEIFNLMKMRKGGWSGNWYWID